LAPSCGNGDISPPENWKTLWSRVVPSSSAKAPSEIEMRPTVIPSLKKIIPAAPLNSDKSRTDTSGCADPKLVTGNNVNALQTAPCLNETSLSQPAEPKTVPVIKLIASDSRDSKEKSNEINPPPTEKSSVTVKSPSLNEKNKSKKKIRSKAHTETKTPLASSKKKIVSVAKSKSDQSGNDGSSERVSGSADPKVTMNKEKGRQTASNVSETSLTLPSEPKIVPVMKLISSDLRKCEEKSSEVNSKLIASKKSAATLISLNPTKKYKSKRKKPPQLFNSPKSSKKKKVAQIEFFEVESILDVRKLDDGKREFLVKWKGFSDSESTWEPESNCLHCELAIKEYFDNV